MYIFAEIVRRGCVVKIFHLHLVTNFLKGVHIYLIYSQPDSPYKMSYGKFLKPKYRSTCHLQIILLRFSGTSVGGLCFGFIYNRYGGANSFRLCSFIAFLNAFLHVVINRYYLKSDPLWLWLNIVLNVN